jgi:hypothetical protein
VSVTANATATFSEAMDASTINGTTVELHQGTAAGPLVAAAVSYDAGTRTVTVNPTASLAASTQYTALVKGGGADPRVKDVAGNALAADHSWSFTTAAAAATSFSINFDGSNDYVSVPDSASLDFGSTGTIELFAKATSTPTSRRGLAAKSLWELNVIQPTSGAGFRVEFRTRTSTFGAFRTITSGNLPLNTWVHVAGTYSGGTQRLFVNGTQVGTVAATGSLNNSSTLVIGSLTTSAGRFPGRIDEVRVSNIGRYTAAFTPPTAAFTSDGNTRALWHFDAGTGTAAADSSPNGNNGTLVNGPTWNSDTAVP